MLDQLMDEYGEGPGHVTGALLTRYKHDTRDTMRARGLREPGAGACSDTRMSHVAETCLQVLQLLVPCQL
jgi:hypothetical protein